MSNHVLVPIKYAATAMPDGKQYGGRCKECGWTASHADTSQAVQEEFIGTHLRNVKRAQAANRKNPPSLKEERDWAEEQAADTRLPKKEREQWKKQAEEMSHRLGDRGDPIWEDVPLL